MFAASQYQSPPRLRYRRTTGKRRRGTSLLEVIGAVVCASMMLVPTGAMLSDAQRWSMRMEQQGELNTLAQSCLNEIQFQIAGNFRSEVLQGSFTAQGFPNVRYACTKSDVAATGGVPNRFMSLQLLVWNDLNADGQWTAGEPRQQLASGVARRR
jgi:hypothetical protein